MFQTILFSQKESLALEEENKEVDIRDHLTQSVAHDLLGYVHVIDFCAEELSELKLKENDTFTLKILNSTEKMKELISLYRDNMLSKKDVTKKDPVSTREVFRNTIGEVKLAHFKHSPYYSISFLCQTEACLNRNKAQRFSRCLYFLLHELITQFRIDRPNDQVEISISLGESVCKMNFSHEVPMGLLSKIRESKYSYIESEMIPENNSSISIQYTRVLERFYA